MPASEETYRSQPSLHIVFAITSVAMTLSIVWMIMADHLRPWKQVQRAFQQVEEAKLKASEKEKLQEQKAKYQTKIDAIDAKIKAAELRRDENASQLREVDAELKGLGGEARASTPGSGSRRPSSTASAASTTARSTRARSSRRGAI